MVKIDKWAEMVADFDLLSNHNKIGVLRHLKLPEHVSEIRCAVKSGECNLVIGKDKNFLW